MCEIVFSTSYNESLFTISTTSISVHTVVDEMMSVTAILADEARKRMGAIELCEEIYGRIPQLSFYF